MNVQHYCDQVRDAFNKDFIPKYLSVTSKTRNELINDKSDYAKILFEMINDQLALVADGTYLYCEKSANNKVQRLLYSGSKKRPHIKPFIVCTTTRYIIYAFGPYPVVDNDAKILTNILETSSEFRNLLMPGDLIILDRGFRDCIKNLNREYSITCHMPTCSHDQLTCYEANIMTFLSRIIMHPQRTPSTDLLGKKEIY